MGEKKDRTAKEYEDLGRQFVAVYDSLNPDRKKVYKTSLIKGLISGLGGVVGATLGIAALLWILSLFDQVPFIGHFVDSIRHTLQSHK